MWPKDSKETNKRGPKGLASPDREQSTITTKNKQNQESFDQNRKPSNFAWSLFQGVSAFPNFYRDNPLYFLQSFWANL